MAASATFALKEGVWFRRGRLLIVSPDSLGTACQLSGRNSTYRPVQILEVGFCSMNSSTGTCATGRPAIETVCPLGRFSPLGLRGIGVGFLFDGKLSAFGETGGWNTAAHRKNGVPQSMHQSTID